METKTGMKSPRDAGYREKTAHKSNLSIEAWILRETGYLEEAATKFAEAGRLEEELQCFCLEHGFIQKSFVHAFSSVYCWVYAGDTHHALVLCENIFKQKGLTEPLKQKAEQLLDSLHKTRKQYWDTFHEEMLERQEPQGQLDKVAA
jgi:hypothetical protein